MASITQTVDEWSHALPGVELEVRNNHARGAVYALDGIEFLIGTTPGCDLRIAESTVTTNNSKQNTTLLCLLSRHPGGVSLRNLAAAKPILVNGKSVTQCDLADGDRVQVGPVEVRIGITPASQRVATGQRESTDQDTDDDFQESVRDMRQKFGALAQNGSPSREPLRTHYETWEKKPSALPVESKQESDTVELAKVRTEYLDLRRQVEQAEEQRDLLANAQQELELELTRVKEERASAHQENTELRRQMDKMEEIQRDFDAAKNELNDRLRKLQVLELDAVEARRRDRHREDEFERRNADLTLREERLDEERRHFEATRATELNHQALRQDELKTRQALLIEISRRAAKLFTAFGVALSGDGLADLAALQQELARAPSPGSKSMGTER